MKEDVREAMVRHRKFHAMEDALGVELPDGSLPPSVH